MPEFGPVDLRVERHADGVLDVVSNQALPAIDTLLTERLHEWALRDPDRLFLREPRNGGWATKTYGEAWEDTGLVAAELLRRGHSSEDPLLILAGNSLEHAMVTLGAMRAGVPVAPISVSYAAYGTFDRLRVLVEVSGARAAYVGPEIAAPARDALSSWGLDLFGPGAFDRVEPDPEMVRLVERTLNVDVVAKLMFTSGSTGTPKAVMNTHRMMVANQMQLSLVWPTSRQAPPVLIDWLPWSHTFGGNFVFNMALWNGGSLTIDKGRPSPALVGKTLEAMAEVGPTRYFNVPAGFEALLPLFDDQPDLARRAFRNVELAHCAGAALSAKAHASIVEKLRELSGRDIPLIGGWGSTETAPSTTMVHFAGSGPANIGVPLPGVTLRLVPAQGKQEIRVKGPNVMKGYWRAPAATTAAFDDDGFYCIGDAVKFVDPLRPECGLLFDGRVAENFKLASGTWVNVGALRLAAIDAARPLVRDAVICGQDRAEVGALLFLDPASCQSLSGEESLSNLAANRIVVDAVRDALIRHNKLAGGSSMRIDRFCLTTSPPDPSAGEITDKGHINQRAVLANRSALLDEMFESHAFRV